MTLNTSAFNAQDALTDALTTAALVVDGPIARWAVDFGLPAGREEKHIWIDESIEAWTQDEQSSGIVTKDEAFVLTLYIYRRQTGATARELRDDIETAAGVVADLVGTGQPFLGGTVMYATITGGEYGGAFADPEGRIREGVLELKIGCQAFLTAA